MVEKKSMESILLSSEESKTKVDELMKRINECEEKGHRDLVDKFPYDPMTGKVEQRCEYCGLHQYRNATQVEITYYHKSLKSIVSVEALPF